jgi:hypothetical protein
VIPQAIAKKIGFSKEELKKVHKNALCYQFFSLSMNKVIFGKLTLGVM